MSTDIQAGPHSVHQRTATRLRTPLESGQEGLHDDTREDTEFISLKITLASTRCHHIDDDIGVQGNGAAGRNLADGVDQ